MAKVDRAKEYHELGWCVVPAKGKMPIGSWKHRQEERATLEEIESDFAGNPNIFLITGAISGVCVLDCDDQQAINYWRSKLGPVLDETACASTGKGKHFYFSLADGERRKGRSSPGGVSGAWDLRADGGGVIVPPSVHHSGKLYKWVPKRGPEAIKSAPTGLWAHKESEGEKGPKSTLAALLAEVPSEGGRNNWLARVAGHLATFVPYRDAFEAQVRANAPDGLEEEEIAKLVESIWSTEQAKKGKALPAPPATTEEGGDWKVTEPSGESGGLVSGDTRILVECFEKDEEGQGRYVLTEFLDADLRVESVFIDDEERSYTVEVRTADEKRHAILSSKTVGNNTRLNEWLAGQGLGLVSPGRTKQNMSNSARLTRYLEIQDAPAATPAAALGWNDEAQAFVTHEGLIREDGWNEFETVRPHPDIRNWAPYEYGHDGADDGLAAGVLREVLTYHDATVTAVFGSWWAACFLKPQIYSAFSLFPVMAIEAPSESGKSTGFFPSILKLSGNLQLNSQVTKAALRDYLSAHRNGITWLDDHDEVVNLEELIRAVTVEGSVVKKAIDHNRQKSTQMRGALCISGESLGFRSQKALADRSIHLDVPNPRSRRSTKGDYPQFDDIVALNKEYRLQEFAGSYVARALQFAPRVEPLAKELRGKGGRHEDKLRIVLLGAYILEHLTSKADGAFIEAVTDWADAEREGYIEEDNTLTIGILPRILRDIGLKEKPEGPDPGRQQKATPVFVLNDRVWLNAELVADYWDKSRYGKIKDRTESLEAIRQQMRAAGAVGKSDRRRFDFVTKDGHAFYKRLSAAMSRTVLERMEGSNGD